MNLECRTRPAQMKVQVQYMHKISASARACNVRGVEWSGVVWGGVVCALAQFKFEESRKKLKLPAKKIENKMGDTNCNHGESAREREREKKRERKRERERESGKNVTVVITSCTRFNPSGVPIAIKSFSFMPKLKKITDT